MKKRIVSQKRSESLSFRPTQAMRERIIALSDKHTRSMADQVEHLVKIGFMVMDSWKTDDQDIIREKLKH